MKSDKPNNEHVLQEMIDSITKIPTNVRKKTILLIIEKSIINFKQTNVKKEFVAEVNNLKQVIENTGPVESNFNNYGHKEIRCLMEIAERIDSYTVLNNRHIAYYSWGSYLLFMTTIYFFYPSVVHTIIRPAVLTNAVSFGTWIFISLMLTSGSFLLINLVIYLEDKFFKFKKNTTSSKFNIRHFVLTFSSSITGVLVYEFTYNYLSPQWIIPHFYPFLIEIIYGMQNLNFNSTLVIISLVLSDIAAIIAALDFIKKRGERRQELTSFLSKLRNESF
jgi:hypothetical protein